VTAVRQFLVRKSLQTQLVWLAAMCVGVIALVAMTVVLLSTWGSPPLSGEQTHILRLRLLAAIGLAIILCLIWSHFAVNRLLRPLQGIRDAMWHVSRGGFDAALPTTGQSESSFDGPDVFGMKNAFDRMLAQLQQTKLAHEQSQAAVARRSRTVDRLLEFSQTIQAAGKAEQVYAMLCHFLQIDLSLAGLAVLSFEKESTPQIQTLAVHPPTLLNEDRPVSAMELAMCPGLRQHLPRHFPPDGAPVRCALEQSLNLTENQSAYCIPFTLGSKTPAVVHMLLPQGADWTQENKQLAQTYVNTAQSALISLYLLAEAEKQSMTDAMTGLYNRRSLDSLLEREVALCERHHHPLSLVMIDMDHFKHVNDVHGHAAGDHLLKSFADCVRITLRKTDMAFRFGGDEFIIALPQTSVVQAQQVVQKLRQAFATVDFSSAIAHLDQQPTLSIGVVERSAANNTLTLPSLLSAVDQALYQAKNSNRNCVKVYEPPKAA
jgi:diguanylate cyclase (GGDEF)-like protein